MHYIKKQFARMLRKEATFAEKQVWDVLRNRKFLGLKFRRQHVVKGFVVDFYCHDLRLAIEIDGRVHEKQKDYDQLRQSLIEENNISFVRVTNEEISKDITILLDKIKKHISEKPSPFVRER